GTPAQLKARIGRQSLQVRALDPARTAQVAAAVAEITGTVPEVQPDTGMVTAQATDPAMLAAVLRRLDDAGIAAAELGLRLPSLDEVFLTLTGHPAGIDGREVAA
ncbi:MAG: DUF4162 domain-containing protein, partial [Streptosporangiaceae bacterium]